jgi:protein-S-isoprenylcysteine O-methyltransferase Ste14
MRASDFEYRHQTLVHLLVVGLAFLTYAFQPDDIVWAFVKHHTIYRTLWERLVFGTGALMIVCSAAVQTWVWAYRVPGASAENSVSAESYRYIGYPIYFGRLLFAFGIGLLAPMSGTAILLGGEIVLVLRLISRDRTNAGESSRTQEPAPFPSIVPARALHANWKEGLRKEASKWGLAVTMIVFTLTLRDRVAEILAALSFLLWFTLNVRDLVLRRERNENA